MRLRLCEKNVIIEKLMIVIHGFMLKEGNGTIVYPTFCI